MAWFAAASSMASEMMSSQGGSGGGSGGGGGGFMSMGQGPSKQEAAQMKAADAARSSAESAMGAPIQNTASTFNPNYTDYNGGSNLFGTIEMPGLSGSLTDNFAKRKEQAKLIMEQNKSRFGGF